MKLRTPEDIKKLGVILGVWAHPDDETFFWWYFGECHS